MSSTQRARGGKGEKSLAAAGPLLIFMGSPVTSPVQSFCLHSSVNTSVHLRFFLALISPPFGTPCSPLQSNSASAKVVHLQVKLDDGGKGGIKSPTLWGITGLPSPLLHSWLAPFRT